MTVKNLVVLQARMGSTRFPGKVMARVNGVPLIELLLERLRASKTVDRIVLATSYSANNDPLVQHVKAMGIDVFRGDESDVLDRYYQAALPYSPQNFIRITGDCPLIDPRVVDHVVDRFARAGVHYATNGTPPTYPDGLNVEVGQFECLAQAWREATKPYDREHVTPYLRDSGKFKWINVAYPTDLSDERWTVDEPEDFEVVRRVFEHFWPNRTFSMEEVIEFGRSHQDVFAANRHLVRDEGALMGTGQKLWKRARRAIPGGSMLLSKRAEMHLPNQWPAYFSKAKGCYVWDLDGRQLADTSFMGIGTNTLGYGHPEVDDAVRQVVDLGNMSTLNAPEEVYLAEALVALHPWAEMARFARSGGEANAIAIRIARAAASRSEVAFCGYHGWHDWYLSANLSGDEKLVGHLLPGLSPTGVPDALGETAHPFSFNRFDELERLINTRPIGVVCMEVMRNTEPADGFLEKVRKITAERGIVLIFDECTSGFRQTFGGLHKQYGVDPDVAVFGKTLGNGYAVNAVIGRRAVMEHAQDTFISSTFWTERIGSAAALKTLEVMERERSWETITRIGQRVSAGWQLLADKHGVAIRVSGLAALTGFAFASQDHLKYKTLLTQEMLAKGFLATTSFYSSIAHTDDIVNAYFTELDPIFSIIGECERGRPIDPLLKGPVCHAGFKRLN